MSLMKRKKYLFYVSFAIYIVSLTVLNGQSLAEGLPDGAIAQFSPGASVFTVAYSPDGKYLASGGDDSAVILWDIAARAQREIFTEHSDSVMSVVFSPDGKMLTSASLDGFVRLWDVASRQNRRKSLTHNGWVKSVAYSPDGKLLASGGGDEAGSIIFWDVSKNQRIRTIPGHSSIVESVAFSPDGKLLATSSRDKTVRLWVAEGQHLRKTLAKHKNVVYAVAFSPDGKLLATSSRDKTVRLWQVSSGENLATFQIGRDRHVYSEALVFSPDGKYLASACVDHSIILWEVEERHEVATIRGHNGGVTSIAFSPDGKTLASGSRDRSVFLWDLAHFNISPSDSISEPIPVPMPDPEPVIADQTVSNLDDAESVSTDIPDPDPVVEDKTPPHIVILSPTARVVPRSTEKLFVQGEVDDSSSISNVKVNGQKVRVSAKGRFTARVQLSMGENEIHVAAADVHGNVETEQFTVIRQVSDPQLTYDLDPPIIFLDVPQHSEVQSEIHEFIVQGRVSDDSGTTKVKINNTEVYVSTDGVFVATIPLSYGETEIRVTASDSHGNMEANRFTVFRHSPPIDDIGPEILILEPVYNRTRGIRREIHINAASVAVSGTVTDSSGVSEVVVDGATSQRTGNRFTAEVELMRGDNVIRIRAIDRLGNASDKEITVFRPYLESDYKERERLCSAVGC